MIDWPFSLTPATLAVVLVAAWATVAALVAALVTRAADDSVKDRVGKK